MAQWLEAYGNPTVLASGGTVIGSLFEFFAQAREMRFIGR
jgi:hypothetical protein